jgi:hypothetical protein
LVVNVGEVELSLQVYVVAPEAIKVAVCPVQNAVDAGTMVMVGKGPLVNITELAAEPQILLTVTTNVPGFVTVIELVVTVDVFQLNGPVPFAVNVTEFPAQIVFADADKLTLAAGPSEIFIVRVIDPHEFESVAV